MVTCARPTLTEFSSTVQSNLMRVGQQPARLFHCPPSIRTRRPTLAPFPFLPTRINFHPHMHPRNISVPPSPTGHRPGLNPPVNATGRPSDFPREEPVGPSSRPSPRGPTDRPSLAFPAFAGWGLRGVGISRRFPFWQGGRGPIDTLRGQRDDRLTFGVEPALGVFSDARASQARHLGPPRPFHATPWPPRTGTPVMLIFFNAPSRPCPGLARPPTPRQPPPGSNPVVTASLAEIEMSSAHDGFRGGG